MQQYRPEEHPDWIAPRADSHVVLSADGSPDALKVFCEPGGSFSPGVGSYGVSLWAWLHEARQLVVPERLARELIRDRLLGGVLPVYRSRWRAGPLEIDCRLAVEACPDAYHPAVALWARATGRGESTCTARLFLVVRSPGPAGGPVRRVAYAPEIRGLMVNDQVAVLGERAPQEVGCSAPGDEAGELSILLRGGRLPVRHAAADNDGLAGAALGYALELGPGETWEAGWTVPVRPRRAAAEAAVTSRAAQPARERLELIADDWRRELERVSLTGPDGRVVEAFCASLTHLTMAAVSGEPRIASVCYPLFWVRDGVYQIHALDIGGLHERARRGIEALRRAPWGGGFGPEADAPGQALWVIDRHHRLTRDDAWLAEQADFIIDRASWLQRLRHAEQTIWLPASNVLPRARLHPDCDRVADPARDGLIVGRMDWHRPLFWVNHWALAGLRGAARLGAVLGLDQTDEWAGEADELAAALARCDAPFGENDRDTASAIWPTLARSADDPETRDAFESWWRRHRFDALGRYRPEPRWRYFELAWAHNMLRLGFRDAALLTLEHFLRTQDAPGLYAWAEGDLTGDPTGDWRDIRGWWPRSAILPHGWASAEMALLIRDLFLFEEGDSLVVGAGVRPEWLTADDGLGMRGAPTWFGTTSWELDARTHDRRWQLELRCSGPPPGGWRLRLPLPPSAIVEVGGEVIREENGDWPIPAVEQATVIIALP